ncbi:hypothetical protein [Rhodococcus sp. SG20037]|uniref:hypothetical protein n=1 Tax=Rhodococcus sp. SG20037 TaxID=3074148 RepID=UPI00287F50EE|nr:hypothetical protein [Rhodococcus sp. SG20037]WNF44403.1 hypothetical protein RHP72_13790 [Rhodococcus sp. SG20037]
MIDSFVKAIARWDSEKDALGCQPLLGLVEGAADPLLGGGDQPRRSREHELAAWCGGEGRLPDAVVMLHP